MRKRIVILDDPLDDAPLTQEKKEKLSKWFNEIPRPKLYFDGIHIADVERAELIIGIDPAGGKDKTVAVACEIKDGRVQVLQEGAGESEKE